MLVSREPVWVTSSPYFKRKKFFDSKGLLKITFTTFETEEDDPIHLDIRGHSFNARNLLRANVSKNQIKFKFSGRSQKINFSLFSSRHSP